MPPRPGQGAGWKTALDLDWTAADAEDIKAKGTGVITVAGLTDALRSEGTLPTTLAVVGGTGLRVTGAGTAYALWLRLHKLVNDYDDLTEFEVTNWFSSATGGSVLYNTVRQDGTGTPGTAGYAREQTGSLRRGMHRQFGNAFNAGGATFPEVAQCFVTTSGIQARAGASLSALSIVGATGINTSAPVLGTTAPWGATGPELSLIQNTTAGSMTAVITRTRVRFLQVPS